MLIQTCTLEDCLLYDTTVYSSQTSKNISLPTSFKLSFVVNVASNGGGTGFIRLHNNAYYIGKGSSGNRDMLLNMGQTQTLETIPSVQTDYEYLLTYSNGVATLSRGTNSISQNVASLTNISQITGGYSTVVKNLKLKPL